MTVSDKQTIRPAPLKLRPYGAIEICLLLLLLLSHKQFIVNVVDTTCGAGRMIERAQLNKFTE